MSSAQLPFGWNDRRAGSASDDPYGYPTEAPDLSSKSGDWRMMTSVPSDAVDDVQEDKSLPYGWSKRENSKSLRVRIFVAYMFILLLST